MCQFFKANDVDFCQFLNGSLTEVTSLFLAINDVVSTIQNEA
jgi:hypothetical protein